MKSKRYSHLKRFPLFRDPVFPTDIEGSYPPAGWARHIERAQELWLEEKIDEAIVEYNKAIAIQADHIAHFLRAGMWKRKKDFKKSIQDYTECIRINPRYTRAYYYRAEAWCLSQEYANAIADYEEVITLDPNVAEYYNDYAWLLATCPETGLRDG